MTPTVVLLALLAAPPLALTTAAERIPLPAPAASTRLRIRPFERRLTLEVPPGSVAAVARTLRGASRLCPGVEAGAASVTLRCTTSRVRADLDGSSGQPTLDLRALTVLPWRPAEEGAPLVPFDLPALGLAPCPGTTPEGRGECLVAQGRLDEARAELESAWQATRSPLAALRLGDLALAADRPEEALERWRPVRDEFPFGRPVAARLCELDPDCLAGEERRAVFDAGQAAPSVRADLVIRAARLRALEGDLPGAVRALAAEHGPDGACAGVSGWCRRLLLLALRLPGPDGAEALAGYLDLPGRRQGPLAQELAEAAARQAEAAGAPGFAAALLASTTGRVPESALPAHLRRVAGLFLAGGDRARAEEIVLFARTHLDRATWRRDGWDALQRSLRRAPPPAEAAGPDPVLTAARAAVEAARLVRLDQGARP